MAAIAVKKRHFAGGGSQLDGNALYEVKGLSAILRNIADDLAALQAAVPAAIAAATYVAPSANPAVTSSQNATAAAAVQGGGYVQADVQSIATLANALKVSYNAAQVDVAALDTETGSLRTQLIALAADVNDIRTKINAVAGATILTTKDANE